MQTACRLVAIPDGAEDVAHTAAVAEREHGLIVIADRVKERMVGLHADRSDDRVTLRQRGHVHSLLDLLGKRQIDALVKVHRRMRPVPAIVGAGIDIERVVARIDQDPGRLQALVRIAAELGERLTRHRALTQILDIALERKAQDDREILATVLLDLLHDLDGGPRLIVAHAQASQLREQQAHADMRMVLAQQRQQLVPPLAEQKLLPTG